jgi:hypothetical protein
METTIENFDRNPLLRELLINYCKIQYEAAAELDDYSLMQEYYLLLRENRLNDLFECEKLSNP